MRLDLKLEKGAILAGIGTRVTAFHSLLVRDESSLQELKVREIDTRIESEIAGLRTAIEIAKPRHWVLYPESRS